MNILKYIITEDNIPIIFSKKIMHDAIIPKAIAAGFLILNYDVDANLFVVKCFGESTTMNLKVSENDEFIIREYLNKQFYTLGHLPEEIHLM
jgi:hypothetical protein